MTARVQYFPFSEEKLYYDEAKKRFVSTKNAPQTVMRQMRASFFKEVSPFYNLLYLKRLFNTPLLLCFVYSNDLISMEWSRNNLTLSCATDNN